MRAAISHSSAKTEPRTRLLLLCQFTRKLHIACHEVHIPRIGGRRLIPQPLPSLRSLAVDRSHQYDQLRQVNNDRLRVATQCGQIIPHAAPGAGVVAYRDDSCICFHAPSLSCFEKPGYLFHTCRKCFPPGTHMRHPRFTFAHPLAYVADILFVCHIELTRIFNPCAPLFMSHNTPLDICNLALSKLGEVPIPAIDPNASPAARLCYMHYHPVRREVLCANRWSFASVLTTLSSSLSSEPLAEGSLPHTLPLDCLRVLEVSSPLWTLRGRCIYCATPSIRVLYISDIEDTSLFDPLFTEALATRLACKLCIPLTSSTTARQALTEEYLRVALPQAAHFNSVQCRSNDAHPLYALLRQRESNIDVNM